MKNKKSTSIAFLSTYHSRQCGIATFTKNLTDALNKKYSDSVKLEMIAMDNFESESLSYPKEVIFRIRENVINDYILAAKKINNNKDIKLVNIQHEFGIFGGYFGGKLLKFVENLKKPIILTLHTVVPKKIHKNNTRKKIVQAIAKKVNCIIVLNPLAIKILKKDYGLPNSNIIVIPHGIHKIPFESSEKEKIKLGYKNKIVLTTFGFIRKSKGLEHIIDSLPKVVNKFPNVLYLIIGEVHSRHRAKGESYLKFLKNRAKELGIQNNVKFINKYVRLNELIRYLKATDLYLCSTTSKGQIVSGTLAYAMGCGRAVISTPFLHAKQDITQDRGIVLKDFKNPDLFSDAIIKILLNPSLKKKMEKNSYKYTRHMLWSNVADSYMDVFEEYLS